ncbi:MRPL44 [Bugula neritina]|uniref:Large ribosomal subunit protein mL44 n=1 Tax=Bugula neritina TaxID=10212 RepID=A0A7J7JZ57_BUGNE|nr:MRPL44 [Bugula neritina]
MALAKTCCGAIKRFRLELPNFMNPPPITVLQGARTYKQHSYRYNKELYRRRLKVGPIEVTPRSKQLNWNEDVELEAFTHRISEKLSRVGVRQAFTDMSYSRSTAQLVKEVIGDSVQGQELDALDTSAGNEQMAESGDNLARKFIKDFIKVQFPHLPEEGVGSILEFLMSTGKLAHVGKHLGITDLILYDVPLVSLINEEQGEERACAFVRDFIITQLIGEDIDAIFPITSAMTRLVGLLEKKGQGEPISRLLEHCGQATAVSCYFVGIYSDNELIGKAPGETLEIAEEMAAHDALMSLYGIQENRLPFDFNTTYKQYGILNSGTQPTLLSSEQH